MPYTNLETQAAVEAMMALDAGPAVIDLWAPWCAPCRAMAPHFEAVSNAFEGEEVRFYKIDTEAHPDFGRAFNVRSIPTVLFVNRGEILDVFVGAADQERLTKKVQWLLAKASGKSLLSRWLNR